MSKGLVGIVDYGIAGNVHSIYRALNQVCSNVKVVTSESEIKNCDRLVLPGVGSFVDGMKEIENRNLFDVILKSIESKPTLGICLGMQILAKIGYEFGETEGFGVFDASVKKIDTDGIIPHVGFNYIEMVKDTELLKDIDLDKASFYFMHSYEVVNFKEVVAVTNYSKHQFVSMMQKDNIFGVQFHPEKSREDGLKIFKNFLKI